MMFPDAETPFGAVTCTQAVRDGKPSSSWTRTFTYSPGSSMPGFTASPMPGKIESIGSWSQ